MRNQHVIITGGASGIGRAAAEACAQRGARVTLFDNNVDAARETADRISHATGAPAVAIACDVHSEQSVETAFAQATAVGDQFQGVFANAGIEVNAPLHETSLDDWNTVIGVNLTGVFLTCKYALRSLCEAGIPGSIVCCSSPSAFVGFAGGGNAAYGASKGGISAMVRSAAIDYAPRGIRVNAVVPGATLTPLLLSTAGSDVAPLLAAAAEQIPLGRMAQPREIAAAVVWLLSDDSSYVTGSHLVCDGGLMAKSANTF